MKTREWRQGWSGRDSASSRGTPDQRAVFLVWRRFQLQNGTHSDRVLKTIESPASVNTFTIARSVFAALFFNTLTMLQDCTLLSAGSRVKNSVKILQGVRRQPFLKVSGITFRNHHFGNTCAESLYKLEILQSSFRSGTYNARVYLSR